MDFNVHDSTGKWIGIVENPSSALWVRNFRKPNDFELLFPATAEILALITDDCYITREDADEVMIVEHIEIITDAEDGNKILVSGRGAESLIGRRIIWEQTTVAGHPDYAIYTLIDQNAINPVNVARKLPITMQEPAISKIAATWEYGTIVTSTGTNDDSTTRIRAAEYIRIGRGVRINVGSTTLRIHLYYYDAEKNFIGYSGWHTVSSYAILPNKFEGAVYVRLIVSNTSSTDITNLEYTAGLITINRYMIAQYTGNNLLDTVEEMCKSQGTGFRAVSYDHTDIKLTFELLYGVDRSEGQEENSPVVFAAEYENLLSSNYLLDTSDYRNVALIAGEGEGKARKRSIYGSASGMLRRELYVDARDLSTNDGEIADATYTAQLTARGEEKIAEHPITENFDGEIDITNFVLDDDYTIGDIVTVENEYGIRKNVRIASIIECWDENGYTAVPTYENVEV